MVDALALEVAVAEDLPGFRPGDGMLDAGANSLVGLVVFVLPAAQFLALPPSMQHHDSHARTATVHDGHRFADSGLRAGFRPRRTVVAIARQASADHNDQTGVGIDDDRWFVEYR